MNRKELIDMLEQEEDYLERKTLFEPDPKMDNEMSWPCCICKKRYDPPEGCKPCLHYW